jgi:hypothetical protein
LTAKRKQAALIKQGMKKDAEKDRLTMIQVMLICLERDTRRSKVSLQIFLPCGCMCFICVCLIVCPCPHTALACFFHSFMQEEGEKKGESGETPVETKAH